MKKKINYRQRIEQKLTEYFAPSKLEVLDESSLHAGHVGAKPEGETHFRVRMTTEHFLEKSRLEAHREVHKVLKLELEEHVHALALELSSS